MGPLTYCNSCGSELHNEVKIINSMRDAKLKDVVLEEIATFSQDQLLEGTLVKIMDKLNMPVCCRMVVLSYVDLTSEMCN